MSPEEAKWWGERIAALSNEELSPSLNIGSSTEDYRKVVCPQIDSEVFRPLRERGLQIFHIDMKHATGVDMVGDVTDPAFRSDIKAVRPRAIFCNNLLEHVVVRDGIVSAIDDMLEPGAYALMSVPQDYPYHPDPIDTGYRVSPEELASIFPGFDIVESASVPFGNYLRSLLRNPKLLVRDAYLVPAGLFNRQKWKVLFGNYRYLIKNYRVACVVLQKKSADG